ncbi:Calcium calmodulin-dependent protein kinase kinase 2 [Gryganskiella cystojenkinii]|nr:Calcium calmodulin-dependent protein kinase kinase 2 [Gryganskiella cystojenkinii]
MRNLNSRHSLKLMGMKLSHNHTLEFESDLVLFSQQHLEEKLAMEEWEEEEKLMRQRHTLTTEKPAPCTIASTSASLKLLSVRKSPAFAGNRVAPNQTGRNIKSLRIEPTGLTGKFVERLHAATRGEQVTSIASAPDHRIIAIDTATDRRPHPDSPTSPIAQISSPVLNLIRDMQIFPIHPTPTPTKDHPANSKRVQTKEAKVVGEYFMLKGCIGEGRYVMELCQEVLLKQDRVSGVANRVFDERHCLVIFEQLFLGIEYIHGQGAVHRDIKPANLLIVRGGSHDILKIGDFGISQVFAQGQEMAVKDRCGTRAYLAPELDHCDGRLYDAPLTDVWSMGVTLHVMFHGELPFRMTANGRIDFEKRRHTIKELPENLRDLIERMLELNPDRRITMEEIRLSKPPFIWCYFIKGSSLDDNQQVESNSFQIK